jgi:hypothetical protein
MGEQALWREELEKRNSAITKLIDRNTELLAENKRLRTTVVALWRDAEHDHARLGMRLTLNEIFGNDFLPYGDDEYAVPTEQDLLAALEKRLS